MHPMLQQVCWRAFAAPVTAHHEVGIICEVQFTDRSATSGDSGVTLKGFLNDFFQKQIEECLGEHAPLSDANGHLEELTQYVV